MNRNITAASSAIGKKILIGLLSLTIIFTGIDFAWAETANKATEYFANLVVFVQFNDNPSENFMNEGVNPNSFGSETYTAKAKRFFLDSSTHAKSLKNYMSEISYGQFSVSVTMPQYDSQADTITPFKVDSSLKSNEYGLVKKVIESVDAIVPSTLNLDLNNDGMVDNITIITDQGSTDRNSTLYPHKTNYDGTDYINGKQVRVYDLINSSSAFEGQNEGVIIHEFMHSVGFPDLYDYSGTTEPVGPWDIMSSVSSFVQYPLAYMRNSIKGWLTIDTITTSRAGLSMVPATSKNGNQAFILKSPLSESEFFVIEYRQKAEQYKSLLEEKVPGSGLIVYRINTTVPGLTNSQGQGAVTILGQDETAGTNSLQRFAGSYFSADSGRTSFGSTDLDYTGAGLTFSDGSNSGIAIKNIGTAGSTITFDVEFADTSGMDLWKLLGGTKVSTAGDASEIELAQWGDIKYIAYDSFENNKVYVSKYENTAYSMVGNSAVNGNVSDISLVCCEGIPYVLYKNYNNGNLMMVPYANSAWSTPITIQVDWSGNYCAKVEGDKIYILCCEGENADAEYKLLTYDGTSLTTIETNIVKGLYSPSLAINGTDIYMSFRDAATDTIIIKKLNSNGLSTIESSIPGDTAKIAFNGNSLYVAAGSISEGLRMWKLSNGTWTKSSTVFTQGNASAYDIRAFGGTVMLAASDQNSVRTCAWYEDSQGQWHQKGNSIEKSAVSDLALGTDNDSICVAYLSNSGDYSYPLIKYSSQITGVIDEDQPERITPEQISLDCSTYTYNGLAKQPSITVKNNVEEILQKDIDYNLAYKNNINAGTATVTITGIGHYCGTVSKEYTIKRAPLYSATLSTTTYTYSGKSKSPSAAVKNTSKVLLTKYTDFTISYSNNLKVGTATATITGKGNYYGTIKKYFKINPKKPSLYTLKKGRKSISVKWKKITSQVSGYQIGYSKSKSFKKVNKYVKTTKNYKTLKSLRSKTRYYVKVRSYKKVGTKTYYSSWSITRYTVTK